MLTSTAAAAPRPLRVVTFNLFHGGPASGWTGDDGELERRLAMVERGLRELAPDVIALQEASIGPRRGNIAERLGRALGMHAVHAPATSRLLSPNVLNRVVVWLIRFNEGPAILSRFPITAVATFDLPHCARRLDPRVLLRAEVATPWGPLAVFSTHVSRDDCQLRRVGEVVGTRRSPLPAIVMGDFNTAETASAIEELTAAGVVDAFRAANPTAPGLTTRQRIYADAPTVFRRIDYIFVVPGTQARAHVLTSRVVFDAPERGADGRALWPSDHYGVYAEIGFEN